jgi:SAM-dependent methyltransferase
MTEWFEEWFGEEYLSLYPHRNEADADRLVGLIDRTLGIGAGALVLDVACGPGRHARAFRTLGYRVVGLDLSRHLLARARQVAQVPLVRGDIRALPIRPRSVDLVVNLFTSFGYFEHDADHLQALRQMVAAVRPGGWFVIDFLNPAWVKRTLVPAETATLAAGEPTVRIERWLHDGGRFVIKSITVPDGRQFLERVRLYERAELVAMVAGAGARVRHQFGTYDGGPAEAEAPRTLLMAQTA